MWRHGVLLGILATTLLIGCGRSERQAREQALLRQREAAAQQLAAAQERQQEALEQAEQARLRRQEAEREVQDLDRKLAQEKQRLAELEQQQEKERQALAQVQKELANAAARAEQLRQEILKREGKVAAPAPTSRRAIRGTIKEVQDSGKFVLSMGRDAGLKQGDTLEVFRLKPKPQYLGKIVVVELKADEAIARKGDGLFKDTLRAGDEVSTSILDE